MNKEEFIKKISELEHTRQRALEYNRKETEKLNNQYIRENCKFKVGDIVRLDEHTGQITKLDVNYNGNFCGEWKKFKKNGDLYAFAHSFHPIDYNYMIKIEPQKQ